MPAAVVAVAVVVAARVAQISSSLLAVVEAVVWSGRKGYSFVAEAVV